jgi:hypothetical protein
VKAMNVELVVPNAIVKDQPVLVDLGGLTATLFYLGRGHTDGDLLVGTPTTLFVGDLVEQGAHPSFEDSYPEEWADALRHLSALRHRYEFLIPGHGKPCSDQFVKTMANTMTTAVRQARAVHPRHPADATKAIPVLPYGPEQSRWFIKRLQETRLTKTGTASSRTKVGHRNMSTQYPLRRPRQRLPPWRPCRPLPPRKLCPPPLQSRPYRLLLFPRHCRWATCLAGGRSSQRTLPTEMSPSAVSPAPPTAHDGARITSMAHRIPLHNRFQRPRESPDITRQRS